MRLNLAFLVPVLALAAGCATSQAATDPTATPRAEPAQASPAPSGTSAPLPTSLPDAAVAARGDLASRLGLSLPDIEVLAVESVDWPDTSLGCPFPGMAYAQIVTPGYRVTLRAAGEEYVYHTDRAGQQILCPAPGLSPLPTIPVTPGQIDDGQPWMPVD